MWLKSIISLVTIVVFFANDVVAQGTNHSYGRKRSDWYGDRFRGTPLYKWQGRYERTGLHFTAGATYTLTRTKTQSTNYSNETGDTTINQSITPRGKLGYYAKVGALHIFRFKRKIFQYFDYGVGVKHFGGIEKYDGTMTVDRGGETIATSYDGRGDFDLGYAFIDFNMNNVIQISPNNWIQNSLGFNVDYRIYGGTNGYTGVVSPAPQDFQEDWKADIHYKLGLGIKLVKGMYLIPSVETPVFTAYGWDKGSPSIRWFSSKYQPLIVSLTFAFLFKKDPSECPPVFSPGDKDKSDSYQKTRD